jgi:hypothetical protein
MDSTINLDAAEAYETFRENLFPKTIRLRQPSDFYDPVPVTEKVIQAIWADQWIDHTSLKTLDGRPVRIVEAGRWNSEGGPDFKGATIEIGGTILKGDVEIHLHSSGWKDHGHEANPAYDQVILDVFLWETPDMEILDCRNSKGDPIPQLGIQPHLQASLTEIVESLDPDCYPFSERRAAREQVEPLFTLHGVRELMRSAGFYRLQNKAGRIAGESARDGVRQAAYVFLAEALGYKHNKVAFRNLASTFNLSDALSLELEPRIQEFIARSGCYPIRTAQVRPSNHPQRRLASLALAIEKHPNLFDWYTSLINEPVSAQKKPPRFEHPFWLFHYHLKSATQSRPVALIGSDRWMEILINVVYPFNVALSREDPVRTRRILESYGSLTPGPLNRKIKQMAYELRIDPPRNVVDLQGLLQIHQDFSSFTTVPVLEPSLGTK